MANENRDNVVLCGDIGGTNVDFGIAGYRNGTPRILLKKRYNTKSFQDLSGVVNVFLAHAAARNYTPVEACFAVAGPVECHEGYRFVKMTNTELVIDTRELLKNTALDSVLIINDFDAISYAINVLKAQDRIVLNEGTSVPKAVRAVLGAGTGLGKNILYYSEHVNAYLPLPSEGGHSDLPLLDVHELKLAEYLKRARGIKSHVCYEDVLSGRGLENIYKYLSTAKYPRVPNALSATEISATKKDNACSHETFEWFIRLFARCARNFALDTLARGGFYIAGGIAAKNPDEYTSFFEEFVKNEEYDHILKNIPVYLITNYDIGLIGAAYAITLND